MPIRTAGKSDEAAAIDALLLAFSSDQSGSYPTLVPMLRRPR